VKQRWVTIYEENPKSNSHTEGKLETDFQSATYLEKAYGYLLIVGKNIKTRIQPVTLRAVGKAGGGSGVHF
jgi:hypothetical protein